MLSLHQQPTLKRLRKLFNRRVQLGAVAGAGQWIKKRGFVVLTFLFVFLSSTTLSAQSLVDSLRTDLIERYASGERRMRWRSLTNSCVGDEELMSEQFDLVHEAAGDSALYEISLAAGLSYMRESKPYVAIAFQRRGLDLARQNGDTLPWGRLAQQIGYVYTNLTAQSDSGAYYLFQSIKLLEENYPESSWEAYYSLAYLQDQLGLGERAVGAITQSYRISKPIGVRMDYGFALFHILQLSLKHEAQDTFNRYWPEYVAFRASAKSMNPQHDAFLNFLLDDDEGLRRLRKFVDEVEAGAPIDPSSVGIMYSNLSSGYEERGQYALAERYVRKAIAHEKAIDREGNLLRYYQQLAGLGERTKNSEMVAEGLLSVQGLRDSIARRDFRENLGRLEVEYETQKTRTELAESQLALSESLRQRNQLLLGGGVLGLLLLFGFLFYQNRLKLQRLKTHFERERRERELAEAHRKAELSNLRALIEGQEMERSRVAKDLHDGLGGLLTTVKAHVASIPDTKEAEVLIDRACTSVRRIAHNMVPQTLADSGLAGSLGDLASQLWVQGYAVDLEIVGEPDERLDLHQRSILLRIVQELSHNVVKHAGAKSILLQLIDRPEGLLLTVEDDGKGFNLDHAKRTGGLGLSSIEQRVAYLEGTITYDSQPGKGTTVTVGICSAKKRC